MESEQYMIAGLCLFLFMTLSKLYSENINHYQFMERLVAMLIERIPTLYFEMIVFLLILEKEDKTETGKRLQGIFAGMQFEKVCDLLNRSCQHVYNFKDTLHGTLKYAYINLPTEVMLNVIQIIMLAVVKIKGDSFKQIVIFLMKIFNPKIGFEIESGHTFRGLSASYRSCLRMLLTEATK